MAIRSSVTDPFGPPVSVPELNQPYPAAPTWISPDGCRLYLKQTDSSFGEWAYVAERTGVIGGSTGSGGTAETGGTMGTGGTGGTGTAGFGGTGTGGTAGTGSSVPSVCPSSQAFGAPTLVPGLNLVSASVVSARFSPDELTAYIGMFQGAQADNFLATRSSRSEPFGTPISMPNLNTPALEDYASATGDGLTLYFESTRQGYFSLFSSTRASLTASFPSPTGLARFHMGDEGAPYVTPDGGALYFHGRRTNNLLGIYRAQKTATGFAAAQVLSVSAKYEEANPVVSPDELTIYFRRTGDASAPDGVWMATRSSVTEAFGPAVSLLSLNIPNSQGAPTWISPDGCRLYLQQVDSSSGFWAYVAERSVGCGGMGGGAGGVGGGGGAEGGALLMRRRAP
jgi:hypothetical protein